jgi:hypothetical protein
MREAAEADTPFGLQLADLMAGHNPQCQCCPELHFLLSLARRKLIKSKAAARKPGRDVALLRAAVKRPKGRRGPHRYVPGDILLNPPEVHPRLCRT